MGSSPHPSRHTSCAMGNSSSHPALQLKFRQISLTNIEFWTRDNKISFSLHPDQPRFVHVTLLPPGKFDQLQGSTTFNLPRTSNEDLIALLGQFSDDESITTVEEVVQALERRGLKEEQSFWTILESLVEVCKALITIGGGVISVGGGLLAIKAAMDS